MEMNQEKLLNYHLWINVFIAWLALYTLMNVGQLSRWVYTWMLSDRVLGIRIDASSAVAGSIADMSAFICRCLLRVRYYNSFPPEEIRWINYSFPPLSHLTRSADLVSHAGWSIVRDTLIDSVCQPLRSGGGKVKLIIPLLNEYLETAIDTLMSFLLNFYFCFL